MACKLLGLSSFFSLALALPNPPFWGPFRSPALCASQSFGVLVAEADAWKSVRKI